MIWYINKIDFLEGIGEIACLVKTYDITLERKQLN